MKLARLIPVRVTLGLLALIFVAVNAHLNSPVSDEVVLAVLGLMAALIVGDSYRPSGYLKGAPSEIVREQVAQQLGSLLQQAGRGRRTAADVMTPVAAKPPVAGAADSADSDGGEG